METSPQQKRSELPIEQQANFEGSWTNLMIERLRNPDVQNQMINLLLADDEYSKSESEETVNKFRRMFIGVGQNTEILKRKTSRELENEINERINLVSNDTPISFDKNERPHADPCGREIMPADWIMDGWKPTVLIKNIVESHEKGHVIRPWTSTYLHLKFRSVLDLETQRKYGNEHFGYIASPKEIVERMVQLKNYFGMAQNEKFTKEHLLYAREHYIIDTRLNNNMSQFFEAITPEKEDAFIELINSAGI